MKLLVVSQLDRRARAINTLANYVRVGKELGHEVAVFAEQQAELSSVDCSLDVKHFDFAIFVVYMPSDFPDLPYLAQVLDSMPKERRIIIDCTGRYNETIRVEHDFNHLEKADGHQSWEWLEAFRAVSDCILQPTVNPIRDDVRPFLFHGYGPETARRYSSPREAAQAWSGAHGVRKPYGVAYVGNNWQRWTQLRPFLQALEPLRKDLGPTCLVGWDWDKTPDWAIQLGLRGADVDPVLLERLGVEIKAAIPFDEVVEFMGRARFSPVFHRPLFNHLGFVTNRTFETFSADTIPLLMLPEALVDAIYGPAARMLMPVDDVAARVDHMLRCPELYWDAVLKTRAHLSEHHSYQQRFKELLAILEN
jgi:hypothetical protein